jgi:hypothetical protein
MFLLGRSKTGSKGRGKKGEETLRDEYPDWALRDFSGYLAADEIHDGPFCVLTVVDSQRQRRLAYEVLDHDAEKEDIPKFFQRVAVMLSQRALCVQGLTTDGSPLYPEAIAQVFPGAAHQVCEFHVLKEITHDILTAVAKIRRRLYARIPKLGRGRPRAEHQKLARKARRMRERIAELFANRYLFVHHGLSTAERKKLTRISRGYPDLQALRGLMDQVYALFDRRCRTETALGKLAQLRWGLSRFKHLGKVVGKLHSPNLEKALTFLDDRMLEATSNSVERANRRHRKMQKSIYRVRTHTSITHRIALDMLRDRDLEQRPTTIHALREARATNGLADPIYPD